MHLRPVGRNLLYGVLMYHFDRFLFFLFSFSSFPLFLYILILFLKYTLHSSLPVVASLGYVIPSLPIYTSETPDVFLFISPALLRTASADVSASSYILHYRLRLLDGRPVTHGAKVLVAVKEVKAGTCLSFGRRAIVKKKSCRREYRVQ